LIFGGAHEALFDRTMVEFGDAMWRLTAGYASNETERKDLYQDILVAIWKALARFRQQSSLRTFVYRIGHNRGLSYRAYERRRVHGSLDSVVIADPRPGPQEVAETRRRREVLQQAIRGLSPEFRQPLMLHLDGLTNPEISEIVGISKGNVAVRLTRARKFVELAVKEGEKS
jgi:RNA polymerase sigma factor (sigma-70 family)